MAQAMKHTAAAGQYAQALLELASPKQEAETIGADLRGLREVLEANPTFASFLRDPGIGEAERRRVLESVIRGKVSELVFNTLGVLNSKNRLGLITHIADAYDDLLAEQLGKIEVGVTVAQRLDSASLEEVRQRISTAFGKDAVVAQTVDESLIGGMILRIGDKLIDGSVKTQLESMKRKMMAAAPR